MKSFCQQKKIILYMNTLIKQKQKAQMYKLELRKLEKQKE